MNDMYNFKCHHDITEILLKMVLNNITLNPETGMKTLEIAILKGQ